MKERGDSPAVTPTFQVTISWCSYSWKRVVLTFPKLKRHLLPTPPDLLPLLLLLQFWWVDSHRWETKTRIAAAIVKTKPANTDSKTKRKEKNKYKNKTLNLQPKRKTERTCLSFSHSLAGETYPLRGTSEHRACCTFPTRKNGYPRTG